MSDLGLMAAMQGVAALQADQRIRAQQLSNALNQQLVGRQGMVTSMAMQQPQLNHLHELLPSEKEFVARNLVMQAQADYAAAVQRGDRAAELAAAARVSAEHARLAADTIARELAEQRARADDAERKLRALRPQVLARIMPTTAPARVQYELRWPWLAASWALVIAGVVVCAL